ncbi:MAG: hypothetical protein EXR71_08210 [Myxococcales bacterium]|nr:hypothetical protein [Myxococcales bacterium]
MGLAHLDAAAPASRGQAPGGEPLEVASGGLLEATERFQRRMLRDALAAHGGSVTRAAEDLGVSKQWLHRLISRWGGAP